MTKKQGVRHYTFRNDSGFTVPPFGVMSVTDTIDSENEVVYLIRRPTYADEQAQDPARLVFNLGDYVADEAYGQCTSSMPCQALCKTGVALNQIVGPVEDSFVLENIGNAFVIKSQDNTDPHVEGTAEVWMVEPNIADSAIVEITGAIDGDGYYPANVVKYDSATNAWVTVRACRVKDAN